LAAGGGALLGGRAVYVWLNAAYFAENPAEAWQLWQGGLNYHGALLGGLAALWLWARLTRRPFWPTAGLFAPGLALLVAFGWAACAVEGCAYGRAAAPGLLAGDLPDDRGVYALRYRTQIAGALGALLVFAAAWWAAGRVRPAALFWGALGGLALVHIVVALGRGDPSPVVLEARLDLGVELGLLAAAVAGLSLSWRRGQASQY
jgi:phosphatidylglycerol:prolipoprotein diacylglycerol transferase